MKRISEWIFFLGFLSAFVVMGAVLYLEIYHHLIPCSLCIFQRIAVIACGVIFGLAFIHHWIGASNKTTWIYGILGIVLALLGLSISLRQVYLQLLPPSQVPACGPGINFIFKAYPFLDALKIVLQGSGECAKVSFRFLKLSLADWGGLYFVGIILLNALAIGLKESKSDLQGE